MSDSFNVANSKVHPVETQWHYPILIEYGYMPLTLEQTGFVRKYEYIHPVTKHKVNVNTGVSADYWSSSTGHGYWSTLKKHLESHLCEAVAA